MKKLILILFLILGATSIQEIQAKGVIIYHTGPQLETTHELPSDALLDDDTHINIGIMYNQFGLFWMPIWNYSEPQYVLVSDDEKTYWDYDEDEIKKFAKEFNIELPEKPEPSLWNKIGLKPVILILVILIIWGNLPSRKKESNI